MTSPNMPSTDPASSAGHETTDVKARGILGLAVAVALTVLAALGGLAWLVNDYQAEARHSDPQVSPLARDRRPSPGPQLQATPNADFTEFRQQQEETLSSYGWIDKQQGIVRVPVSRAIEILAERGLPTPSGPIEERRTDLKSVE